MGTKTGMGTKLADRVTLITGASQGIGRSIALRLAREGSHLALTSRRQEACEEVAEEARSHGVEAIALAMDVGDAESVAEAVTAVTERFDRVDNLVNNAGITRDNLLLRMSQDEWDEVIRTDLTGVFLCSKAVLRSMLRQRRGRIVSITSVVGLLGNPGQANYAAAKSGILGFTKSLAREIASRGITVNAIAPGYIDTEMTRGLPEEARERLQERIPLGRLGSGDDVAGAVAFLLSEDAAYVTGQVVCVDGGMCM